MESKKCSKCGLIKPIGDFQADKSKKSGYKSQCKACIKSNPGRKKYMEDYRSDHKDYFKDKHAEYRSRNREKLKRLSREYYDKKKEDPTFMENNRARARIYYQENVEYYRKYAKDHRKDDKVVARKIAYKARRRGAQNSGDHDITLKRLYDRDGGICKLCGRLCDWDDMTIENGVTIVGNNYPSIDHITPISKGGSHTWDNVQLVHKICNSIKRDKEE